MQISDEEILQMIKDGVLLLTDTGVYKFHNRRKQHTKLTPQKHPKSGRFRYYLSVGDKDNRRTRTIFRNKLIWMFTHRKVVPDGYDIDHKDYDNTNDSPENLRLRESSENRRDNTDKAYNECVDFFSSMPCPTVRIER